MLFPKWFRAAGIVLLAASASTAFAQSQFRLKEVIRSGQTAPVPAQISSPLEESFNDAGQVAVLADGGILLISNGQTRVAVAPSDPDPNGGIFEILDAPVINAQGQILFRGTSSDFNGSGLFLYSNGTITSILPDATVASDGQEIFAGSGQFAPNGAFLVDNGGQGLYLLSSDGSLDRVIGPGDPAPGGDIFSVVLSGGINASGQIVLQGFLASGANAIFLKSGDTITKIISSGDVFPDGVPLGFPTSPSINDAGQVSFGGVSNSIQDTGVFLYSQGTLSLVVPEFTVVDGNFLEAPTTTSINNAGQIAFAATIPQPNGFGTGIFLYSNGQVSTIQVPGQPAPEGGTFISGTEIGAVINNQGKVLFFGTRAEHGLALYLASGSQISRVIGQGDTIPHPAVFVLPFSAGIGNQDTVLISDQTFPGGMGAFTGPPAKGNAPPSVNLAGHVGQQTGNDGVISFIFGFSMNHNNQVAFNVVNDSPAAIALASGGTLTVLADDEGTGGPFDVSSSTPAINSLGEVAYTGFDQATLAGGIYLSSHGQSRLLFSNSALPGGGSSGVATNLALNKLDTLVFEDQPLAGPAGVFLVSGGKLSPLALSGNPAPGGGTFSFPFFLPRQTPAINDKGDIAFAGQLSGVPRGIFGSGGVFLYHLGTLSRIVGPGDPSPDGGVFRFADAPTINIHGDVAFFAETSQFTFGVFLYSNGIITQVSVAGDTVNGEEIVFTDLPQVNDNGHVAFTGDLLNGDNAIFVGAPNDETGSATANGAIAVHTATPSLEQIKACRKKNLQAQSRTAKRNVQTAAHQ